MGRIRQNSSVLATGHRIRRAVMLIMAVLLLASTLTWMASSARADEEESAAQGTTSQTDTSSSRRPVCIIARVSIEPIISTEQGDWALSDDEVATASDNVDTLCTTVSNNTNISLTLAISPLLLERWSQRANDADSATFDTLCAAIDTGRVELVLLGYGDPNLSQLQDLGYLSDLTTHYQTTSARIPLDYGQGTAPLGLTLGEDAIDSLSSLGLNWCAVDSSYLTVGPSSSQSSSAATCGIYTSAPDRNFLLLSVDTGNAQTFLTTTTDAQAAPALLTSFFTTNPTGTYVTLVDLSTQGDGKALASTVAVLAQNPAYVLMTADAAVEAADSRSIPPIARINMTTTETDQGLVAALADSHMRVEALHNILYSTSSAYDEAQRDLLVGEFGAWTDLTTPAKVLTKADLIVNEIFEKIHIDAEQMVLAGTSGTIPMTIVNNSDAAYEVDVVFEPGDGMTIDSAYADGVSLVIYSGENYLQVPVQMTTGESHLTCKVVSNDEIITQVGIQVKTSRINTITIIVCIIVLIACTVFLIHRHRMKNRDS